MEKKKFRVALVGCGVIAPNHLSALADLDETEIVALCDIRPERAERRREEFAPAAQVFDDYSRMLREVKPDAVHIATPHYLHAPMAIEALDMGIHVFLEKPMAMKQEEIPALLAAEQRSPAKLCVCFQNRFNLPVKEAGRRIAEDGGVISAFASVAWERSESYYRSGDWRGKQETEGGGVLINQAIHTIDLLCYFLGKPKIVEATTANHHLRGVIEVEDTAEARITFEDGRIACLYATTAFPGGDFTNILLRTKNHRLEIRGNRLLVDDEIVLTEQFDPLGKACYGSGHAKLIAAFYRAIAEGKDSPVPGTSAQYALRILLAAYRSGGEPVEI